MHLGHLPVERERERERERALERETKRERKSEREGHRERENERERGGVGERVMNCVVVLCYAVSSIRK